MNNTQSNFAPEKFQNAEQIWFWFIYSKSVHNDFARQNRYGSTRRICELVDVETLVTKLHLCGKLSIEHLTVMKTYGDKRRAPHQYIWRENHDAAVWDSAMRILNKAARDKGWIE
ncbi:MAG: hypothetical protein J5611_00350 [Alphaproteobacteria bacterium]|jgi:hypothetical protein|nr:hypothetical protein [Alphaproteobacteria bacterium]